LNPWLSITIPQVKKLEAESGRTMMDSFEQCYNLKTFSNKYDNFHIYHLRYFDIVIEKFELRIFNVYHFSSDDIEVDLYI